MPEKRLVVLIDKKNDLSTMLLGKIVDQQIELRRNRALTQWNAKAVRLLLEEYTYLFLNRIDCIPLTGTHIELENGIRLRPVPLRLDRKTPEKLTASFKETLKSGNGKRLAKTPRACDKELRTNGTISKRLQNRSFIDIDKTAITNPFKGICICRNLFHVADYSISVKILPLAFSATYLSGVDS